jgi:glycerophosphoryl diester phosphodiesterase
LFEAEASVHLRRAWALPLLRPFSAHPQNILCDGASVRRWHQRGYRVAVWTVDAPAELRRLATAGADALITNDPAAARAALRTT